MNQKYADVCSLEQAIKIVDLIRDVYEEAEGNKATNGTSRLEQFAAIRHSRFLHVRDLQSVAVYGCGNLSNRFGCAPSHYLSVNWSSPHYSA